MSRKRRRTAPAAPPPTQLELDAQADAALAELYARVPDVDCQGLCHTTCGPIEMSNRERRKIAERHGVDIPEVPATASLKHVEPVACPALTMLKRCGVYEDRPMICRIWGATETLPCIYGCAVKGEPLPPVEASALIADANAAGGWPPYYGAGCHGRDGDDLRRMAAKDPRLEAALRADNERGLAGDVRRARALGQHPMGDR